MQQGPTTPPGAETPLTILLVEGNREDAGHVADLLKRSDLPAFAIKHAGTLDAALHYLRRQSADIILMNLFLPDARGLATGERFVKHARDLPWLALGDVQDPSLAVGVLKLGAQDYLLKQTLNSTMLARVIHYAMERSRLAQMQHQQIEKLKELDHMKSEFVSVVSHELRTPITSMRSAIGLLEDGTLGRINGEQKEYIALVQRNIERLSDLVNDVLSISRIESGRLHLDVSEEDLVPILEEVVNLYETQAAERNVTLALHLPEEALFARCDADKIIQILANLLSNALVHNPEGIHVVVGAKRAADRIELWVSDDGTGIAQEEHGKIFDRFYQTRRVHGSGSKGTGLGLAICKGLVEAHGGTLRLDSVPGRGSTFRFDLKRVEVRAWRRETAHRWTLPGLTVTAEQYGDRVRLMFAGRIDETSARKLSSVTFEVIRRWGLLLVIDLSQCDYINSRGLGHLIELRSLVVEKGGDMVFLKISPKIKPVLDAIGLLKSISCYTSLWPALSAMRKKRAPVY